jgi:hypothetical protein
MSRPRRLTPPPQAPAEAPGPPDGIRAILSKPEARKAFARTLSGILAEFEARSNPSKPK